METKAIRDRPTFYWPLNFLLAIFKPTPSTKTLTFTKPIYHLTSTISAKICYITLLALLRTRSVRSGLRVKRGCNVYQAKMQSQFNTFSGKFGKNYSY